MTAPVAVVGGGAHLQAHVDGEGGGRWGSQQAFGQGRSGAPGVARLLRIAAADLPDPTDPMGLLGVMDTIQEGALTLAVNEAWLLMGGCTLFALVLLHMLGPIREPKPGVPLGQQAEF